MSFQMHLNFSDQGPALQITLQLSSSPTYDRIHGFGVDSHSFCEYLMVESFGGFRYLRADTIVSSPPSMEAVASSVVLSVVSKSV